MLHDSLASSGVSPSGPTSVMAGLAGEFLDGLPELTDRLLARILEAAVEYGGSSVPMEDLRQSCQENLTGVLAALAGDRPLDPEAPETTGRRRAEQGFPLAGVLHAFRVGGRLVWEELVEPARAGGDADFSGLLVEGGRAVWEVFDASRVLPPQRRATIRTRRDPTARRGAPDVPARCPRAAAPVTGAAPSNPTEAATGATPAAGPSAKTATAARAVKPSGAGPGGQRRQPRPGAVRVPAPPPPRRRRRRPPPPRRRPLGRHRLHLGRSRRSCSVRSERSWASSGR